MSSSSTHHTVRDRSSGLSARQVAFGSLHGLHTPSTSRARCCRILGFANRTRSSVFVPLLTAAEDNSCERADWFNRRSSNRSNAFCTVVFPWLPELPVSTPAEIGLDEAGRDMTVRPNNRTSKSICTASSTCKRLGLRNASAGAVGFTCVIANQLNCTLSALANATCTLATASFNTASTATIHTDD